jgi:hypothetical protein
MIGTGAKTDTQLFFPDQQGGGGKAAKGGGGGGGARAAAAAKPGGESGDRRVVSSSTRSAHAAIIQPTRPRGITHGAKGGSTADAASAAAALADLQIIDERNSGELLHRVDLVAVDRIFSSSAQLGPEAIVHFVSNLCAVSREELGSSVDPQVYSLQKLVEIAYYNMGRVRLVWAKIWEVLGDFFTEVGQHSNASIAMYAIDSLRQLSQKFLEKPELLNFSFQRDFLKPFVDLMGTATSLQTKELILGCLEHMVMSRARSIRSGWRPMLSVCALAAGDTNPSVAMPGFELCKKIIGGHADLLVEHQPDAATCLAAYLSPACTHEQLSLAACQILVSLSEGLREQPPPSQAQAQTQAQASPAPAAAAESSSSSVEELSATPHNLAPPTLTSSPSSLSFSSSPERAWWPLLGALSSGVADHRPAVRSAAQSALFRVLAAELAADGGALPADLKREAYAKFVLCVFEDRLPPEGEHNGSGGGGTGGASSPQAASGGEQPPPSSSSSPPVGKAHAAWLSGQGLSFLTAAERCFCGSCALLGPAMLDGLISVLVRCLQQRVAPTLAPVAAEALLHLVKETGASFSQETWASVCMELKSCFVGGADGGAPAPLQPPPQVSAASSQTAGESGEGQRLVAEVSQRVQREAPPGSGPHDLQLLLLSTVYQLLQINHPLMKLVDVEGLLECLMTSFDKAHAVIGEAIAKAVAEEVEAGGGDVRGGGGRGKARSAISSPEIDEALALEAEAMGYYTQILLTFYGKLEAGASLPAEAETPPLGSEGHLLLIGATAECRLIPFCQAAFREYLRVHELAMGGSESGGGGGGGEAAALAALVLAERTPGVVSLLSGLLEMQGEHFERHLPSLSPLCVDLMHCDAKEVRQVLRDVFSQRIGTVLHERQKT